MRVAMSSNLLDLPDLVLHNICTFITSPFDLLHFGNTCSRLRGISSSKSLWWTIALQWCRGLWIYLYDESTEESPREWLLEILRHYTVLSSGTEVECLFPNGERWQRAESKKFRCIFGMLRLAYTREKDDHPAVLYEQWLYDIGLYRREGPCVDYRSHDLEFSENAIIQFATLGQAADRDLRRRKQPNKDLKYYIKRIAVSEENWMSDLFPVGPHGSICPLLMCPFQDSITNEVSGLQGLAICLSLVLGNRFNSQYKSSFLPLKKLSEFIKFFCTVFVSEVMDILPAMESRLGTLSLKTAVVTIVEEKAFRTEQLQTVLDMYKINAICEDIFCDFSNFLKKCESIDYIVDEVRLHLRDAMKDELRKVLFPVKPSNNIVTRINLTDSDLIGGDNSRQEMSSAAFLSDFGVLVTWHLTGRMRF